jgi:adenosine deaminase
MTAPGIDPLADIPIPPAVAALPKADLHVHQEEHPRLDRIFARREGRTPYDWAADMRRLLAEVPPGMPRLRGLFAGDAALVLPAAVGGEAEEVIAKLVDLLEEGAADGAILIEVRAGPSNGGIQHPEFMALFREAERRVRSRYPLLCAEAIGFLIVSADPAQRALGERTLEACLRAARDGLAGVDLCVYPYDTEADPALWEVAARWARRATDAGLGVTIHAGEVSLANLAAATRVPGVSRLGHAVYAAADPRLTEEIARRGITIECCLTCNVIVGGAPSYEEHPLRRFGAAGIPVTLNTDDPVRLGTTIGREYAIAAALGLTPADLLACTRNAIRASFTSTARRAALLAGLATHPIKTM